MGKFTKLGAALVLVAAQAALPTSAAAAPDGSQGKAGENRELQAFCYDLIASGDFPGLNLGECMSFNNTSDSGFKAHLCDFFREAGALGENGFSSYSDCVRNVE